MNDLAEVVRLNNPPYAEKPFMIARTPEDFIPFSTDHSTPCFDPSRHLDFDGLSLATTVSYDHDASSSQTDIDNDLPSLMGTLAYTGSPFGASGLSETGSSIDNSLMFRLDSDHEADPPTLAVAIWHQLGLTAMDSPLHCVTPTSSVDSALPPPLE